MNPVMRCLTCRQRPNPRPAPVRPCRKALTAAHLRFLNARYCKANDQYRRTLVYVDELIRYREALARPA